MGMHNRVAVSREQAYQGVGPGWRQLVDRAFDAVEALGHAYRITSIGGESAMLAVAVDPDAPELWEHIRPPVAASLRICELCGEAGEPGCELEHLWEKTLCPEHHAQRDAGISFVYLLQMARDPALTWGEIERRRAEALRSLAAELDRQGALPVEAQNGIRGIFVG